MAEELDLEAIEREWLTAVTGEDAAIWAERHAEPLIDALRTSRAARRTMADLVDRLVRRARHAGGCAWTASATDCECGLTPLLNEARAALAGARGEGE